MIIHTCKQNSEEWERVRLAVPTSSEFHKILCPKMGTAYRCSACAVVYPRSRKKCECGGVEIEEISVPKLSTQSDGYMHRLLAEWYFQAPLEDPTRQTQWMERGHALEEEAVRSYEFETGNIASKVGFITTDEGLVGTSPDRLVGDDGILEIKCPSPAIHMGYMLNRTVDEDYWPQVQGQLLISGRKWVDIQSYCPPFPTVIIRVPRDDEYMAALSDALAQFVEKMLKARILIEKTYGLLELPAREFEDTLGVSDEDVTAILANRETF